MSTWRLTTVCSPLTICAATTIGSTPCQGREPCVCRPVTTALQACEPAMNGPAAIADGAGVQRRPGVPAEHHFGFVVSRRCPPCSMTDAPPSSPGGAPSSAGWNTNRTLPRSVRLDLHQRLGHTHEHRGVRIVPAGVHDAHFLAAVVRLGGGAERHVGAFHHRQRVHVGAQRDRRTRLTGLQEARPRRCGRCRSPRPAELAQVLGDDLRGAHFAVGEFRVLMEVAPPGNDFRINGIERGIELGGRGHAGTESSRKRDPR